MNISINNSQLEALVALYQQAPEIVEQHTEAAVTEAQLLLLHEVKENTPLGSTNLLRQSFGAPRPVHINQNVIGVVGTSLLHAVPVELGTKPHFPPTAPIHDWVKAKLGLQGKEAHNVAYLIALKISHHGTKGKFFVKKTFDENQNQVQGIYVKHLKNLAQAMTNG